MYKRIFLSLAILVITAASFFIANFYKDGLTQLILLIIILASSLINIYLNIKNITAAPSHRILWYIFLTVSIFSGLFSAGVLSLMFLFRNCCDVL